MGEIRSIVVTEKIFTFCTSPTRSLEGILKSSCRGFLPRRSKRNGDEADEKKEYPPDLTLPGIKNGIYSTDEFRMYTFKSCFRAYSHERSAPSSIQERMPGVTWQM